MGFFSDLTKSERSSSLPFNLAYSVHPLRLPANRADYVELAVSLENASTQNILASLLVELPKGLGFDQSALSQAKEIRIGELAPGARQTLALNIHGTQRTKPGAYDIVLRAASHYHSYSYVLNEINKTITLRVV